MNFKQLSIMVVVLAVASALTFCQPARAATTTVRGRIEVVGSTGVPNPKRKHEALPTTVVWLTPVASGGGDDVAPVPQASSNLMQPYRLTQKNKSFDPHILVVPAGAMVEFPNRDPFFHNVFSLFEGKRFDLGLYEAGTTRMVKFDRPGISYIFCNIHPEMSAVVITIATPFFAISNSDGQLAFNGVPYGRYIMHIWSEGMGPESEQPITREITIAENSSSLGVIRVPEVASQHIAHKNMYGREYDDPTPNSTVYEHQR